MNIPTTPRRREIQSRRRPLRGRAGSFRGRAGSFRGRAGSFRGRPHAGFTLLELVIAVTILGAYLLPLMLIVTKSKVRAIKFTQQRELRDLAQRKLFDRIHYYVEDDSGTFELEGRPEWTWTVPQAQMVGQGEQPLLEYMIIVEVPQKIEGVTSTDEEGSVYELRLWSFPDERWYEEQEMLAERGLYTPLYGDPALEPQY